MTLPWWRAAERVVLPGQGAMRDCMRELREAHGGELLAPCLMPQPQALMGCGHADVGLTTRKKQDTLAWPFDPPGKVIKFVSRPQATRDGSRQGAANGLESSSPGLL